MAKKAKKAASSVKKHAQDNAKKVEKVISKSSESPNPVNIRQHVEQLAGERRDCAVIWTVIKNNPKYSSREDIVNLIKAKNYETLLGEIS
jgi:hypothetical protein